MTIDTKEGRRLEAAATPGPWRAEREPPPVKNLWLDGCPKDSTPIESTGTRFALGVGVGCTARAIDAALIVWLRNHAAELLAAAEEMEDLRARYAIVARREAELHYAVRKDANILDHKLTEDEAHQVALKKVERLHAAESRVAELEKEREERARYVHPAFHAVCVEEVQNKRDEAQDRAADLETEVRAAWDRIAELEKEKCPSGAEIAEPNVEIATRAESGVVRDPSRQPVTADAKEPT